MEHSLKYYSNLQESKIASALGWKQVSGSGSRPFAPGDIKSNNWLGECKTHMKPDQPILFYFDVWDKIVDEASSQFRNPVLFVDDGSQKLSNTYCLIDISNYGISVDTLTEVNSKSIRYSNTNESLTFIRNNKILCIMDFNSFKEFIELGE